MDGQFHVDTSNPMKEVQYLKSWYPPVGQNCSQVEIWHDWGCSQMELHSNMYTTKTIARQRNA